MSTASGTFKVVRVRTRAVLGHPDVEVTFRAADGSFPPTCVTGPCGSGKRWRNSHGAHAGFLVARSSAGSYSRR